jgi:hypothetical protein
MVMHLHYMIQEQDINVSILLIVVALKLKEDEDLPQIIEALRAKACCHGKLWGDHDSPINQLA